MSRAERAAHPMAPDPAGTAARGLTAAFTDFGRVLRRNGVPVATDQLIRYRHALARLDPTDLRDLYWAGRACLLSAPTDVEVYDALFAETFLGGPVTVSEHAAAATERTADGQPGGRSHAAGASESDAAEDGEDHRSGEQEQPEDAGAVASSREQLRHKAFSSCTPEEAALIDRLLRSLRPRVPQRRVRRVQPARSARRLDLRRTVRRTLRTHGEPVQRHWRRRRQRPRRLVLLLDVSGSMSGYSRALLQFGHSLAATGAPLEVFCFGTRLTRVTESVGMEDPDAALAAAARSVMDWDGGTRIGHALRSLLEGWRRQSFLRGSVVIICSDGLERGDPDLLGEQMQRLTRIAYRIVWVNPLKGEPGYQPLTRGMQAALPHVDHFVAGDSLASLEQLAVLLQHLDRPSGHDRHGPAGTRAPGSTI